MKKLSLRPINDFDEDDFDKEFWTDGQSVFYRYSELEGAEPLHFMYDGYFGRDPKLCFCGDTRLTEADSLTFRPLNFTFAMDKSNVYTLSRKVKGVDIETFEVLDDGKKLTFTRSDGTKMFAASGYAKDKNSVYFHNGSIRQIEIVKNADIETFTSMNDGCFAKDKNNYYLNGKMMISQEELHKLLYEIPDNVDYTTLPEELDWKDIASERIKKLKSLLETSDSYLTLKIALLLTHWGVDTGFDKLNALFFNQETNDFFTHRLHGYDQGDEQILNAVMMYRASQMDMGGNPEKLRERIFPIIKEIIYRAEEIPTQISIIFSMIKKNNYTEFLPILEQYQQKISNKSDTHHWQLHDVTEFLKDINYK